VQGALEARPVRERLPHAHEHDVREPSQAALLGEPRCRDHLVDDLGGSEVAVEAALAGGAERAGHAAAGLRGHARGHPVRVGHDDALDERAVVEAPHGLDGLPVIARVDAHRAEQLREQRLADGLARGGGQVGHEGRVADVAAEVLLAQLLGAEGGLPDLGENGLATGQVEVGEVPRRSLAGARFGQRECYRHVTT
jgi:hypothetical protein